jgi:hypothetical protein
VAHSIIVVQISPRIASIITLGEILSFSTFTNRHGVPRVYCLGFDCDATGVSKLLASCSRAMIVVPEMMTTNGIPILSLLYPRNIALIRREGSDHVCCVIDKHDIAFGTNHLGGAIWCISIRTALGICLKKTSSEG